MKTLNPGEQVLQAIKSKDVQVIKALRERKGRDKWLNQFGGGSVPITAWIDPEYNPDPFGIEIKK
jgi:hypothetical protein